MIISNDVQERAAEELEASLDTANKLIGEAADEAERLQDRIEELERDVEFHRGEATDAENNEKEAKKELALWADAFVNNRKMQCAIHDFMREQGYITDAARDVPFHSTPTVWQTEIDALVQSVTP